MFEANVNGIFRDLDGRERVGIHRDHGVGSGRGGLKIIKAIMLGQYHDDTNEKYF